jgi:hypothetical protein
LKLPILEIFNELQLIDEIVIFGKRAILKIRSEPSRKAWLAVLPGGQPRLLGLAFVASRGGVARFARGRRGGAGGLTGCASKDTLSSRVRIVLHELRQGR